MLHYVLGKTAEKIIEYTGIGNENKTQDTTKKNKSGINSNINKSKEDNENDEENVGFDAAAGNIIQPDKNHFDHPNFRIESNKSNDSIFLSCKLIINSEE